VCPLNLQGKDDSICHGNVLTSIGFTGTRKGMSIKQMMAIKDVLGRELEHILHHGDCVGSDEQAHNIALNLGLPTPHVHPPTNSWFRAYCKGVMYEPKSYHKRNRDIVDASRCLLATPDGPERRGSGTWSTINYARKQLKPVLIIYPDGSWKC